MTRIVHTVWGAFPGSGCGSTVKCLEPFLLVCLQISWGKPLLLLLLERQPCRKVGYACRKVSVSHNNSNIFFFNFGFFLLVLDLGTVGTSQKMKRMCQPQQCGPRCNAQYHRNVVGTFFSFLDLGNLGR